MFVKRLVNWVANWGGPLGTATGQQVPLPIEPILDQTKTVTPDAALRILICVNGVLKHVNTPDSYLRERCANIVDSVRSLA